MINICKAGFYYSGNKDWFVCFCCGSSIRAEKLRNVPWNFHRTMKPWCQFLILSKGRPFLRKMHFTHNPILDGPVNEMKFEALINHLEHKNNCYIFVNHEKEFRLNSLSKQMRPKNPIIPNFKLDVCTVNPKLMQKEMLCRICGKERMEVVFLPCNHLYSCIPCSVNSKDCKQCGKEYSYAIRLFVYYAYNYHIMDGTITFVPYLNPLLCKMCEYSEIEVAFIPCKHVYSCFACAAKLDKCLLCNIKVAAYINLKLTSLSPDL
uniref:Baculoviral IAP repeat-containing protein 8 n=2 Tax=Sipha flava TaxID=143950 RepID=A0A2S2Q826_9HEMI